ncbi:MAG: hypothetical protein HC821_05290 [Lewinella sp.]|nr:hypothetical protein [Lewinella sp.]
MLCLSLGLTAQAPSGFKFQAVARNAASQPLANQAIAVRISLLQGSTAGTNVYTERHQLNTSSLGVF